MKTLLSILLVCLALITPAFAAPNANTITAFGHITTVKKSAITISIGDKGDELKSFKITQKTKIKLDGHPSKWEDLKAGMEARIEALEPAANSKDKLQDKEASEIEAKNVAKPGSTPDPLAVPAQPKP
jgi:hypothetical protein